VRLVDDEQRARALARRAQSSVAPPCSPNRRCTAATVAGGECAAMAAVSPSEKST
jgi:hypothetical protein